MKVLTQVSTEMTDLLDNHRLSPSRTGTSWTSGRCRTDGRDDSININNRQASGRGGRPYAALGVCRGGTG